MGPKTRQPAVFGAWLERLAVIAVSLAPVCQTYLSAASSSRRFGLAHGTVRRGGLQRVIAQATDAVLEDGRAAGPVRGGHAFAADTDTAVRRVPGVHIDAATSRPSRFHYGPMLGNK